MGKLINKFKKKEDYSFLSEDELIELNNRGLELKNLFDESMRNKDYKSAQKYSLELADIIKKLRKYKQYVKN